MKEAHIRPLPVACLVRTGFDGPDDDEDVLEVRPDVLGGERECPWLLEHQSHNVVAYVPLAQKLQANARARIKTTLPAKTFTSGGINLKGYCKQ